MKQFLVLPLVGVMLASCGFEKEDSANETTQQLNTVINEITQQEKDGGNDEKNKTLVSSSDTLEPNEFLDEEITDEVEVSQTQPLVTELEETVNPSNYSDYSSELVGSKANTVIFFHASWCPSCTAAEEGILAGDIPEDLIILKADFDTQLELRKKYRVVAQHTFVAVDADGELISKWVGGTTVEAITERL